MNTWPVLGPICRNLNRSGNQNQSAWVTRAASTVSPAPGARALVCYHACCRPGARCAAEKGGSYGPRTPAVNVYRKKSYPEQKENRKWKDKYEHKQNKINGEPAYPDNLQTVFSASYRLRHPVTVAHAVSQTFFSCCFLQRQQLTIFHFLRTSGAERLSVIFWGAIPGNHHTSPF